MRRFTIGLTIFIVVMALVVGGLFWYVRRTHRLLPPISVPQYAEPEDNGFEELAEAVAAFDTSRDLIHMLYDTPWNEENPEAERLVRMHNADLRRVRAALAKECLHPKAQGAWETWPYLDDARMLTLMLIVEGRTYERHENHDSAANSYSDALRLVPVLDRNGVMIHVVLTAAFIAMVAPELERCVGSGHVSEGVLAGLGERLDSILSERAAWHEVLAEEWAFDQTIIDDMETGKSDMRDLLDTTSPVPPRL